MKPNKLLAPDILQAASAVNAKGLGLEIYKQYIKYFGKQTCTLCAFIHQLFTYCILQSMITMVYQSNTQISVSKLKSHH